MKKYILIVDDSRVECLRISYILEAAGYVPVAVNDGYTALEHARKYRFDAVLTDVQMPYLNGFQLLQELLGKPEYHFPRVVLMSGSRKTDEDVRRAVALGAKDYIIKPVDPQLLTAKIERALTGKESWGEWQVSGTRLKQEAFASIEMKVTSLSEMGLRLSSPIPLPKNMSPRFEIPALSELGITLAGATVLECEPKGERFSIYITFLGLGESQLKKIRAICWTIGAGRRTDDEETVGSSQVRN